MVIFHSYVKLPEGSHHFLTLRWDPPIMALRKNCKKKCLAHLCSAKQSTIFDGSKQWLCQVQFLQHHVSLLFEVWDHFFGQQELNWWTKLLGLWVVHFNCSTLWYPTFPMNRFSTWFGEHRRLPWCSMVLDSRKSSQYTPRDVHGQQVDTMPWIASPKKVDMYIITIF
jgi:hypothetical protein